MASAAANAFWAENRTRLVAMHERGKKPSYIAAALGCSLASVCNRLAALAKAGEIVPTPPRNARTVFTPEMDAALTAALAAGGSYKDHAAATKIDAKALRRRAGELGIRSSHASDIDWVTIKPKIKALREALKPWTAIAEACGISEAAARRVGGEMGLLMRLPTEARADCTWTKAAQDKLVTMFEAGKSVAEIAEAFGATRGAISSQVTVLRRVGRLPPSDGSRQAAQRRAAIVRAREAAAAKPKVERPAKPRPAVRAAPAPRAKPIARQAPLVPAVPAPLPRFTELAAEREPVDLMQLEPGMCRWPYGDRAPFKFCGCRVSLGSYCPAHAAKAHPAGKVAETQAWAAPRSGRGLNVQREARA